MFAVPYAARVACWLNAWLSGRESADAVITGVMGEQAHMEFVVFGHDRPGLSPALLLGELRRHGVHQVSAALPAPGDPLGLGGPPRFNADALEAGEALLLHDVDVGLVPRTTGRSTRWESGTAAPPGYLPDVAGADRVLRGALTEAANALADLDVASWNPDVADALLNLRQPARLDVPMSFPSGNAAHTAISGLRCRHIIELAFSDHDGGAVSAWEAEQRRAALMPLHRASRAAIVAACSSLDGR
ncbi:MAG TPA: hypothetical protein VH419_03865 [Nocardioidaceae bacterium]